MNDIEPINELLDNKLDSLKNESKHGGKRKGAGRQKGSMNKATMDTKITKRRFQQRVNQNADKLFNAQLDLAIGEKHLMVVRTEGTGKNRKRWTEIVENPDMIRQYLDDELMDDDEHYYYMTTKPANNQAIDSLLNRSFGKATEKVEFEGGLFKASQLTIKVVKSDGSDRVGTDSEREAGDSERTSQ